MLHLVDHEMYNQWSIQILCYYLSAELIVRLVCKVTMSRRHAGSLFPPAPEL